MNPVTVFGLEERCSLLSVQCRSSSALRPVFCSVESVWKPDLSIVQHGG